MAVATGSASPEPFIRTTRKRKVSYKDSFSDDEDTVDRSVKKKRAVKVSRKSKRSSDTDDEDQPFRNDESDNDPASTTSKPATKRKITSKAKESSKPKRKSQVSAPDSDDEQDGSDDSVDPEVELAPKPKLKLKRRPRKRKPVLEDGENGEGVVAKKPRRNKHDPPAIPLLPTEDGADRQSVDPTQVTMADLCEDPGVGRISSRYDAVLESYTATKQRRKEHRVAMLERALAKQRGEALDGEQQESQSILAAQMRRKAQTEDGEEDELFDYDESVQAGTHQVAQIRLDADGNMVLDEETLQVDRAADPNLGDDADMIHIEENDVNKFVNAGTHTKKVAGARWSKDETEFFYDVSAGCNYCNHSRANSRCRPSRSLEPTFSRSLFLSALDLAARSRPNSTARTVSILAA